jgi:hypothetical protein
LRGSAVGLEGQVGHAFCFHRPIGGASGGATWRSKARPHGII